MTGTALGCDPRTTWVQLPFATPMIVKVLLIFYLLFFIYVDISAGRYIMLGMDIFIPVVLYIIILISEKIQKEQ